MKKTKVTTDKLAKIKAKLVIIKAERDCFESQCDYYKADLDAIRKMIPDVKGVCTQDLVRDYLQKLQFYLKKVEIELKNVNDCISKLRYDHVPRHRRLRQE